MHVDGCMWESKVQALACVFVPVIMGAAGVPTCRRKKGACAFNVPSSGEGTESWSRREEETRQRGYGEYR